ncbi:MAG: T9SS type B sorting domain-containing protein, partial [Paludibacteraceae bacterium]|nr:T9SS type B sorting domain-containing protein [Paludibacteraceae bacterium]
TSSKVECADKATAPTVLPLVKDVCGNILEAPQPEVGGTYTDCEGTKTYTYTYKDCAELEYVWTYTYTIERADFTMPKDAGTTIACASELKEPTLPEVEDACGNKLTGVLKSVTPSEVPTCDGTVTYVYTFTDCANHAHDWEFVYTIAKPTMTFSGTIADVEGVVACYSEEQKTKLLTAEAVKSMYTSLCNRTITVSPADNIESDSDCGWKITRTYTISDGGCNTDTKTMSVSGSDKTAPALVGTWPKDIEEQDNCVANADITGLMSDEDVKALYKDCGTFEVTHADATTGDDCGWTVTRTYTIKDKCNNATTKTMSVSGSDKTAPALVGTWPKDIEEQDNCVANADITGLMSDEDVKALYKDCGTFEVTHADATTGDDCGWTVTRTYTIKDKCNNATTKTMSVSGSDKTAPALEGTRPEDISGQNTCFANADLSGLKDVDYIKGIYSDVCGDVNVTYSEEKNETDCGWSVKRTYLISDFCKNSVSTSVTVSGMDAEKPIITTTAVSGDKGCNPTIVAPTFTVTDNCDNNVQVQVTTTGVQGAGYKKTQTWTATAKDVCGNSAEPVVIVYTWIEDSSTPFAVQMPADMVICQGSSVKLIPTIQGDPTSFSWKQGGTEVSTDETYTATPNETTTYHFTAVANECISSSGSVTITVEDPISFDLNEKDLVICEGTSVSLEPINIQGDLAQAPYSWTKNGVVVSSAAKLIDTPSANATYELTISGNKCAKARKSVSVTVEKQPSVHLRLSDNEVCEDENVTLQVTYSNALGLEWLSKEEGNSEFTVFANNLSATNEVVATNDIMYQVRSTGNQACPAVVSDAVALTVEPKMEISLPSEIAICSKDEKTIEATFSRTPTSIVWMVKNANAANYHQTKFTEAKIVVNPNVSSYYKVIASSKNCPTAEAEVLLKVEDIPNWKIISQTNNVCEGDEVELSTDLPSDYNFVWEAKTHGSANYERLPESTSKLYDSPMESTTYRLSVQTSAGCSAGSKLYDVKVDKPVYGSIADIAICDGDSGRLSVFVDDKSSYSYYWSDMPDYSNVLSRQTSVRVAPKTTTSYYLKIVNGVCTTEYEAEAEVRTLPEIVGIEDMGNRMYRIQVEGGSVPYSYTWGKNSMPTSSDIMERPTYGMTYNVTVTDAIGCKVSDVVEVPTYELEIPEYFFPEIEKWKVKNLDRFYGSKVTIYDRFGKMLREYDVDQFNGWDGTYLGSPMPSTDYWYVISIQELDKELVGHFTLRRRNK